MIEATLPSLYKQSRLLALRKTDESGHSQYLLLNIEGDSTVVQEVVVFPFSWKWRKRSPI